MGEFRKSPEAIVRDFKLHKTALAWHKSKGIIYAWDEWWANPIIDGSVSYQMPFY